MLRCFQDRTRARTPWFVLLAALPIFVLSACASPSTSNVPPGTRADTRLNAKSQATVSSCTPITNPIGLVEQSVVRIETPPDAHGEASAGTGFVVQRDVVLTNQHVVAGVTQVRATFIDGTQAIGEIYATDSAQDLALILVHTGSAPPIVWGDDRSLSKGARIAAIGYALDKPGPPAVTVGTFEETYVDPPTGEAYLLSDLALQHGDSGGPLINQCGQVVGVDTAKIRNQTSAGLSIPEYFAQRWANEQLQSHK